MERLRINSSPEFVSTPNNQDDPHFLEGVAAEVKLLLKLIREHNSSSDSRQPQRLGAMLSILDDIRTRIEKSRSSLPKGRPELRRCNTELRRSAEDKKTPPSSAATGHDLHRQLGLEKMFHSVSKEREMIANELSRRVHELTCMEEMVGDLRKQNARLLEKARVCAEEHMKEGFEGGGSDSEAADLRERNGELTEQLLRTVEGYRSAKRRLREVMEEKERVNGRIAEAAMEAAGGVERARRARERMGGELGIIGEEIGVLERAFIGIYRRLVMPAAVAARGSPMNSPARGSPRDSPLR